MILIGNIPSRNAIYACLRSIVMDVTLNTGMGGAGKAIEKVGLGFVEGSGAGDGYSGVDAARMDT